MQTGSTGAERRCPDCGALASVDAEWCGQCFRSLREPEPANEPIGEPANEPIGRAEPAHVSAASLTDPDVPAPEAARHDRAEVRTPTWPCPTCGNDNGLELDACAVCGTTFASLMRQDDAPPEVDPKDALSASLLYPGLGHRKVGRGLDGLARGVLFTVLAAMALTVLVSGVETAGMFAILALFLGAALIVYFGTAWEAFHIADGGTPVVSSRALLWATVVVILGSVMLLAVSVLTLPRR